MLRDGRGGQVPLGRSEEEELAAAASPHRVGYRPGSDLFSKEGLDSTNRAGQLRLLVHCEGCPHFLTMIPPAATIATLQEQVSRQHRELFASSMGDIPSVKIRWLEDSHRHALPLQGTVGALLADREKIYAASRMDFYKAGDEGVMVSRTVDETVSRWRDVCEQTAAELCAAARNEDRQAEVTEGGGLACLLCIALHIGTLVPGDITLQSVHSGLRHLLKDKDSGRSIVEAGCGGQVVALLQVPDPDLAALGAFLCARMAADRRSHATLISWGVVLQLAKALTLSSNPAFRFDVTTTLKLLASNPLSHSFMSDQTVLRALRECARDAKDVLCQAKVIGVVAEAARSGTQKLRDRIGAEGMELIIDKARHSEDESVRRAASQALAALRSQWRNVDSNTIIPAVDEDLMHRSSISTPTMNEQGEAARCAHFEDEVDGSHIREAGGSASAGAKAWITALLGVAQSADEDSAQSVVSQLLEGLQKGRSQDFLEGGGLRLIGIVLRSSHDSAAPSAAKALGIICRGGEKFRSELVRQGGVLVALTLCNSKIPEVQGEVSEVLASLSLHKQLHSTLIEQGAMSALLSLVHSTHERVKIAAVKALSHLASNDVIRAKILQDKNLAKMVASIRGTNPSDSFSAYLSIIARQL